ncbi:6-hydroxymethylpterin diphosphokinase MptE-like protein [uncultured Paraglaciecola sp.]|uniref:6-hydroxymethylpterin diphosphokinase MptE-like protein n=1 Tax=uncultured Paraglaciecola sp. TaxID=1765024 RepID=UPI0025FD8633|nr:6-hydroxymethylpterin diphosphokinase MptE-like protein [uncultured Paraglaciecola sp.]
MLITDILQFSASALKTNRFNEHFLYNVNRDSFSKISAKVIFDTEFKKKIFDEDSLYIIIGTDSGLLPKYIQEQGVPLGTRYLFIEIDEILNQLHQHQLLDFLDPSIICTSATKWKDQALELKLKDYSFLRNVKMFKAICAQQASLIEYPELSWKISEELQSLQFQFTSSLGTQFFIRCQIQNIADNILPVKSIENIYKGRTAIVLAGGPSLTKILPWVKENRNKLVIFSVSRISRQLINTNIEPDFVCSVDPAPENIDVSKEMFLFKKSVFIHSHHVDPALVNQWTGVKLYFGNRFPWKTNANPKNINSAGPTVSNSALAAAHYSGCKQILLAGFDLCFTAEGITHAEGSDEAISGPKYDSSLLEVETYSGVMRTTEPEYHIALQNLGFQAGEIKAKNKTIINLSADAAIAENVIHTLPENFVFAPQVTQDTSISIPQLGIPELQTHYQLLTNELNKAIHHLKAIKKLAIKALKINNEMYSEQGSIENPKDKQELDSIERQLKKKHKLYAELTKSFGVRDFIRITSPYGDSELWGAEKAQEIGKIYYTSYKSASSELLSLFEDTLLRTQTRTEELKDNPDFSVLIRQWTKDKSYNRINIWKNLHSNINIPETARLEFKNLSEEFQSILNTTDTAFKKMTENQSSLALLKAKATLLFKHNKTDKLKDLLNSLRHIETTEKEDYQYLISAYIAEQEGDTQLALELHNKILNIENSPLLEEALLRVTAISIRTNDHSNTLLALKCLSQLSPTYLPFYAESAHLTGDNILAIDCYTEYVNFFPEDLVCKLKLTRLYMDMKVYEAAELMLEHILTVDPGMEIALTLKMEIGNKKRTEAT